MDTADKALREYLSRIVDDLRSSLGNSLYAVMLHGSLATETFHAPKSDIDLLVLVDDLSQGEAGNLYALFERHHLARPYMGGLETHVIRTADARTPSHPMPFLVHFSEDCSGPQPWTNGLPPADSDITAHLMVAKHRGHSLYGPDPQQAIGEVSWNDFLVSIRGDIDWILEDENLLTTPFYGVLNLCRSCMMAEAQTRILPAKEEAGVWALSHLPATLTLIVEQALAAYRSTDWPQTIAERRMAGGPWPRAALIEFRDAMRSRLGIGISNRNGEAQ